MDNDDQQVGRILSRREVLLTLGAAGAAFLVSCGSGSTTTSATTATAPLNSEAANAVATVTAQPGVSNTAPAAVTTPAVAAGTSAPTCIVSPALTEGPYFVDEKLNRSDIRADAASGTLKEGTPLELTLHISQVTAAGCTALAGAMVDIWHCDAQGVYSDVNDQGFTTTGQNFLRGYQITDANGMVKFTSIYPGWYSGRAVHIHFKVRTEATSSAGQAYEFTSQFFFDDALSAQVFTSAPYASKGKHDTLNSTDGIYRSGGNQLMLPATKGSNGYAASFAIGIDFSAAQSPSGPGGPPPRS